MKRSTKHKAKQMSQDNGGESTKAHQDNSNVRPSSLELSSLNKSYHQSCQTVSYDTFLQIKHGASPKLLLIGEATATDEQLQDAWDAIFYEYADLLKTPKSQSILMAWRELRYLEKKKDLVAMCITMLRWRFSEKIANELMLLGYDLITQGEDHEEYERQIRLVEIEAMNLDTFIGQAAAEYEALCPKEDEATTVKTLDEYDDDLAVLGKFMGFRIDKKIITAAEHASYVNAFNKANQKD